MMWFQKTQPTIEFWSVEKGLEHTAPPIPATQCIPDWFKQMPSSVKDIYNNFGANGRVETAKQCPAYAEFFKQAYVLRMWTDFKITINKDHSYYVESADDRFEFTNHGHLQFQQHLPDPNKYSMVLKAISPWRLKTPKGWSVLQLPMLFHYDKRFEVLPGSFWSDIHHECTQQMAFFDYGEYIIERGTPLCMFIPVQRNAIKHKVSEFTDRLYNITNQSYLWWAGKFKNGYKEHQRIVKKEKSK